MDVMIYDVIIIGGGPAGLSAAVVLGRCKRKVLLFDHGMQRNRYSHGMHNYLTRDGISPNEFLELSFSEVKKYGVEISNIQILHAGKDRETFMIRDKNHKEYHSRKLLLATGLRDVLPNIPGIIEFYGSSVHHCPYCDGWEVSGKKIAVYSKTKAGIELANTLTTWSNDITLFTDGGRYLRRKSLEELENKKIRVVIDPITSIEGKGKMIQNIVMENGRKHPCDAMFFSNGYEVQSDLVESLGCKVGKNTVALTNKAQQTNIPGLYVVGDASKDMHFVVVAAAEGAKAGVYIHKELMKER